MADHQEVNYSFKREHRRTVSDSRISEVNSSLRPPPATVQRRSSLSDLRSCDKKAHFLKRKPSYFVPRDNHTPLVAVYVTSFYSEFYKHCSLTGRRPSSGCLGNSDTSLINNGRLTNSLGVLETLTEEGDLTRLCHTLYLKEIRRINPCLSSGQLFVDGLYELIMRQVSLPAVRLHPVELLTLSSNSLSLLGSYWECPHSEDNVPLYLTVASSFVQYILTKYGSGGVAEFLTLLPSDGCKEEVRFHGNDLKALEYKWKCFVEAESNSLFRLNFFEMIFDLLRKYYRQHMSKLLLIMLSVLLHVSFQLGLAITFSSLLTLGFMSHNTTDLIIWFGSVLGLLLLRFLLINLSGLLVTMVTVRVGVDLRQRLSTRVHQVAYCFFTDHSPGSVLTTYCKDVTAIEMFISVSMTTLLWACLMLCTCIVYATVVSWYIGIPLAVVFIASHTFVTCMSSYVSRYGFGKDQATDKSACFLKDTLDGFTENKIYRTALVWVERIGTTLQEEYVPQAIRYNVLIQFIASYQSIFPHFIGLLLMCGIVLLSSNEWVEFGRGLSIFLMYQLTLMSMATAGGHYSTVQSAKIGLGRINAILNNTSHNIIQSSNNNTTLGSELLKSRISCRGKKGVAIVFDKVCFCYTPTSSHWSLYNVTFTIRPGERIALIGKSGSGKSTILNLLLQVIQPTDGAVFIDGCETTGRPDGTAVAIFQYNHIFSTTIRDNIAMGRHDATEDEIHHVAGMAGIHDWITSLPRGYDTPIRPGTTSFSGGQRQRLAIARMLLSNAPVLLLDEVTSSLDPLTASHVFNTLMNVTKGRTVIAVTHQIEQAKYFDRILVLSHGQLKETGTHTELLSSYGTYHKLLLQEEGGASPYKPTPIRRQHSLTHIVNTPQIIITKPVSPLKTVSEEHSSLLPSTIVFETGSHEKPIVSLSGEGHSEEPFPRQLTVPSSTPYKEVRINESN